MRAVLGVQALSTVISVGSEAETRLEIEMGRCGILLVCTNVRELMRLFRRYCADGRIIFVRSEISGPPPKTVDYVVNESEGPDAVLQALRSQSPEKKPSSYDGIPSNTGALDVAYSRLHFGTTDFRTSMGLSTMPGESPLTLGIQSLGYL